MTDLVAIATTLFAPLTLAPGADPAEPYLGDTRLIYQRPLADGRAVEVRLSNANYATVFGETWRAPTGTADCLGEHAVFVGVDGFVGLNGSSWMVSPWFAGSSLRLVAEYQRQPAATTPPHVFVVSSPSNGEMALTAADGTVVDRASISEGIVALVDTRPTVDEPELSVVDESGVSQPISALRVAGPVRPECSPGDEPVRPLPAAGTQPADPAGAEAEIRQRQALLVDQSIPNDRKPTDLLDDSAGVADAVARIAEGPYVAAAASAKYSISELVFTDPRTAWYRYLIDTSNGPFGGFGMARFNGTVWQISRATICQDLA